MNSVVDFNHYSSVEYQQIETRFDAEFGMMWAIMRPQPRPCFNKTCLQELLQHQAFVKSHQHDLLVQGQKKQINYFVLASAIPGVFNLGGDLSVFKQLILAKEKVQLQEYARLCIENVWAFYNMQSPTTTISLVQGQAMGGGFESALSAHLLIAERSALMGMPEVLFNLFPGMGALSFLSRRVGMQVAEKIVRSGKIYTGEELYQMGVVDVLAEDGMGEYSLMQWVKKNHRSANSLQAINRAKQRVNPLTYDELNDIVEVWVEAALRLDERNLKVMERLIRAQNTKAGANVTDMVARHIA